MNILIVIPRFSLSLSHQQQSLKFVLLNARSIRQETLLVRDYIVEHDIDFLTITETWLCNDVSDHFYCRDICPEGCRIEQIPRNYARGGGVALVYIKCVKAKLNSSVNVRSFELIDVQLMSARNLRLAVIYRPPPSSMNSFTVGLFLDEFSYFLEGLVLALSALLVAGDFNFHVDDQEDDDARRFLQVLELHDLTQHVSHSTHKYVYTLDLIITRANDDLVGKCFVHDPLISDHLAAHVSLRLAKLPPERRTMSYRRIHAIDFHELCRDLENSSLVRDAETSDLSDFVNKYSNTLKSLLDTYAPLRTKTITLRPTASWYNDEIRSEKRRRRALERRWRSSKLECNRLRFQEQSRKVNHLIKATKMEFYSGIIRDRSDSQTLFNTVFRSVTSSDILQLIGRSTIKSCPLDPVLASVLKQCISVLLPVMTRIINQSICSAVVPESLNLHC
ncbi:uncharacterized protein [Montipora capricornis]|uniref:uncharacterized protein n=1 Tax=Montipora capricornis TaxID=246305 RepID=UPI0035F1FE0F